MRFHLYLIIRILFKRIMPIVFCLIVSVVTFAQVQDTGQRSVRSDLFNKPAISPSLARELDIRIAKLDSEFWQERVQAADWLRGINIHDAILEDILDSTYLSTEQRHQLLTITVDRILNAPVGAIGIQMDTKDDKLKIGVRVIGLIAGMAGEKVIKVNDLITSINGKVIFSTDGIKEAVSAHQPGDKLQIGLNREVEKEEQQTLQVELELTEATRLNDNGYYLRDVATERLNKTRILVATKAPPPVVFDVPDFLSLAQQHPRVLELRRQLKDIKEGRLERTPELEESWNQILAKLREQTNDTNVGLSERNRRREILIKYLELLNR